MNEELEQMREERKSLGHRIYKLGKYVDAYRGKLSKVHAELLSEQRRHMGEYLRVLDIRIALATAESRLPEYDVDDTAEIEDDEGLDDVK